VEPKRKRGRQSAPANAQAGAMPPPTGASTTASGDGPTPASAVETFDQFRGRQEVRVNMPDELKELVVDDWDMITRNNKLCRLPATKTIDDILNDYVQFRNSHKGKQGNGNVNETVTGIREYFNEMLGVHLLYKCERPQFNDLLEELEKLPGAAPPIEDGGSTAKPRYQLTSRYGFPHLLRLFVKIGQMLAYTDLDQKAIKSITGWLHEFLDYLTRNKANFFRMDDYITPPPDYLRRAYAN